jgi:hypothetical protein
MVGEGWVVTVGSRKGGRSRNSVAVEVYEGSTAAYIHKKEIKRTTRATACCPKKMDPPQLSPAYQAISSSSSSIIIIAVVV